MGAEPGRWLHLERHSEGRIAIVVRSVGGGVYERAYVVDRADLSKLLARNSDSIHADMLDLVADPDWPHRNGRTPEGS